MNKTKVIIVQRIFSDYRKAIFDRLDLKYNLLLLHGLNQSGINQIDTNYSKKIRQLQYYKKETSVFLFIYRQVIKFKPEIIIHEFSPSILSLYPLLILKKFLKFKIILWGHGFNKNKTISTRRFSIRLRLWLANKSDAIIVYSENGKKELSRFIPENKVYVAYNTLDTEKLIKIRRVLENEGIESVKNKLNSNYKINILFIGRLLEDKIYPQLFLEIIQELYKGLSDFAIHIIGKGPKENQLKLLLANYKNVYFHGAIYDDTTVSKYIFISDLILNPGYVGLSVNHAFCFNKPVFTYKQGKTGPFHSPEIEFINPEETGFLIPAFDIKAMANSICNYVNNKALQKEIQENIERTVLNTISIEKMIGGFEACISNLTNE